MLDKEAYLLALAPVLVVLCGGPYPSSVLPNCRGYHPNPKNERENRHNECDPFN